MPTCTNNPSKTYSGNEKSPLGLGYHASSEPINKMMIGKDGDLYIIKKNKTNDDKRWIKIHELSEYLTELDDSFYNTAYKPKVKKMEEEETGLEEKFGGNRPFFVKGEKWPSKGEYHMTFFGQLKDPRKDNNILYRIFVMLDDQDICEDYWITKIELNDENKKKQVIIEKPKYPEGFWDKYSNEYKFKPYLISSWETFKDIKSLETIREIFKVPAYNYGGNNTLYNMLSEAFYENGPEPGVKVGGTPLSTQDQESVQSYDFLQLEETSYLPYMWGDAGIAHVSEDCEFTWDCC